MLSADQKEAIRGIIRQKLITDNGLERTCEMLYKGAKEDADLAALMDDKSLQDDLAFDSMETVELLIEIENTLDLQVCHIGLDFDTVGEMLKSIETEVQNAA